MTKQNIVFNTEDYIGEDDALFMADDLGYLLDEYIVKSRGEVKGYAITSQRSSHYGAIGGNGASGYTQSTNEDLVNSILSATRNSDKIVGLINDDGELQVNYYDHDGVHMTKWARITKSTEDRFDNLVNYGEHDDVMKFIEGLPSIKAKRKFVKAA